MPYVIYNCMRSDSFIMVDKYSFSITSCGFAQLTKFYVVCVTSKYPAALAANVPYTLGGSRKTPHNATNIENIENEYQAQ